jgi:phenylalanyl-tRNA synthetase beta chain
MKAPISWIKDFVDIDLPIDLLAYQLTMAGLEVDEIHYVGLPMPGGEAAGESAQLVTKITGIAWDPAKIVVAAVLEVDRHPNADRLVLCQLDDGQQIHTVLTGASNLYPYKGRGRLEKPLKVAYAREGAQIFDGHQPGQVLTTLKRARIRGVDSYSMICSEKELGISDAHEGVIILDDDAPTGAPLVDYMGDAVLEISLTPNLARDANILGVAREIAAITARTLHQPDYGWLAEGPEVQGMASVVIEEPELNPRFVVGLIRGITIGESPYWVQRRLHLAGMRPINNIVDATNYVMLEIGQPLHAFDYDRLVQRAGGKPPTILTRRARPGESLTTLDGLERTLDDFTVLVCDTSGPVGIAGVMGGQETEVTSDTRSVLLEGAAWNFISVRRTVNAQKLPSEAAYRFSRGVHPAMASRGVGRGLEMMRRWSGGTVCRGLLDNYPLPPSDAIVEVTPEQVMRWLGIELSPDQIAEILNRLEFKVEISGDQVRATTPDHRLDIGRGVIGVADLMEEIARVYGYERIPETRMADELPHQLGNPEMEREERVRDLLVTLGLQEVVTYRMTSMEREGRLQQPELAEAAGYVRISNPIASDRDVLRRSLAASLLDVVERNARLHERIALFEIGPVFTALPGGEMPLEEARLAIALTGRRQPLAWQGSGDATPMDFYDLKGVLEALCEALELSGVRYLPPETPGRFSTASYHPGKCARILHNETELGVLGELHPLVRGHFELPDAPLLVADLDLAVLLESIPSRILVEPVPAYPPVLEDLALVVDESVPAERVESLIRRAGGKMLAGLRLFDVYRGGQTGEGKKSLAYSLTYQSFEKTLTDEEVLKIRQRIIRELESELGAKLRS